MADKHGVSEVQISLVWLFSKDNAATVCKAAGRDYIEDNYGALSLEFDEKNIE